MTDRKNLVYTADDGTKYAVLGVAAYLAATDLGFIEDIDELRMAQILPNDFRMRYLLAYYNDTALMKRREHKFYVGKKDQGIFTMGGDIEFQEYSAGMAVTNTWMVSSTTGELRTFASTTDPGGNALGGGAITTVTPTTP